MDADSRIVTNVPLAPIHVSHTTLRRHDGLSDNDSSHHATPSNRISDEIPSQVTVLFSVPGMSSLLEEVTFVIICSMGQLLFAIYMSSAYINQVTLVDALGLAESYAPWPVGAFLVANGISVVISGSLADLTNPKFLAVGSFAWLTAWGIIGVFSVHPSRKILYFFVQAMSGLAVGTLCSSAMSMLGRVYKPGLRKNRVFALMGAMIPMGFAVGALQGGALSAHLEWVFGSTAILTAICTGIAWWCIPSMQRLVPGGPESEQPSLKEFDIYGAGALATGCGLLIFGLTQAAPTGWTPYTYILIIISLVLFGVFVVVEGQVKRPLVDNRLWKISGFIPLMMAYFLAYGAFVGGCIFYAVRFFLTIQHHPPIIAAVYLIPIGIGGTLAAWVTSRLLHVVPGHFILLGSMLAFASGPAFFLPQTPHTIYWALSFPGFFVSTFGPDLSFAAISVFITSNVPRAFQGSAGSLLITAQNLSSAVFAALADTVGRSLNKTDEQTLGLHALHGIWWLSLASCLTAAGLCAMFVRIPKSEERDHVQ